MRTPLVGAAICLLSSVWLLGTVTNSVLAGDPPVDATAKGSDKVSNENPVEPADGSEQPIAIQTTRLFSDDVYKVLYIDPKTKKLLEVDEDAHKLVPVLRYAYLRYGKITDEIRDYSCKMAKQERYQGKLRPKEIMTLKLRHEVSPPSALPNDSQPSKSQVGETTTEDSEVPAAKASTPFSVYLKYLAPKTIDGREVVFTDGANHGMLTATRGGEGALKNLTLSIPPNDPRAMKGNQFPITEIGILNLTHKVIEEGVRCILSDTENECLVSDINGAKINNRPCRYIQLKFPEQRDGLKFHIAQILIDEKLGVPVRFAAYYWPSEPKGKPRLIIEYTYFDVKTNISLKDNDFSRDNPKYNFYDKDEAGE